MVGQKAVLSVDMKELILVAKLAASMVDSLVGNLVVKKVVLTDYIRVVRWVDEKVARSDTKSVASKVETKVVLKVVLKAGRLAVWKDDYSAVSTVELSVVLMDDSKALRTV